MHSKIKKLLFLLLVVAFDAESSTCDLDAAAQSCVAQSSTHYYTKSYYSCGGEGGSQLCGGCSINLRPTSALAQCQKRCKSLETGDNVCFVEKSDVIMNLTTGACGIAIPNSYGMTCKCKCEKPPKSSSSQSSSSQEESSSSLTINCTTNFGVFKSETKIKEAATPAATQYCESIGKALDKVNLIQINDSSDDCCYTGSICIGKAAYQGTYSNVWKGVQAYCKTAPPVSSQEESSSSSSSEDEPYSDAGSSWEFDPKSYWGDGDDTTSGEGGGIPCGHSGYPPCDVVDWTRKDYTTYVDDIEKILSDIKTLIQNKEDSLLNLSDVEATLRSIDNTLKDGFNFDGFADSIAYTNHLISEISEKLSSLDSLTVSLDLDTSGSLEDPRIKTFLDTSETRARTLFEDTRQNFNQKGDLDQVFEDTWRPNLGKNPTINVPQGGSCAYQINIDRFGYSGSIDLSNIYGFDTRTIINGLLLFFAQILHISRLLSIARSGGKS